MKFQNITSKRQVKESIEAEQITVSPQAGYNPITQGWNIKNGKWGHEYVLRQSRTDRTHYCISAVCLDPYDIPFSIEFATEQKPNSIVEVLRAEKGSRTYKSDKMLKWTKPIALLASTLIQHGYCKG